MVRPAGLLCGRCGDSWSNPRRCRTSWEVLRNRGLSSGDRVLLCLPDSPDLVQLLLACLARGVMAFLANPELHRDDHALAARNTEPALVVTSDALRDRFQPSRVAEAAELMSEAARVAPGGYEPMGGDALAYATYTSGTTGPPKAAIHRHADPLTFVDAMCRKALRLTPEDTGLCSARMYFAYGLGNSVWFPLATGGSAVINSAPVTPEAAAILSARFGPSVLYGVPNFFARVIDSCSPDSFRSLRCVVSAGRPLSWVLPSGSWNSLAASPFWTVLDLRRSGRRSYRIGLTNGAWGRWEGCCRPTRFVL